MSIKDFEEKGNTETICYSESGGAIPFLNKVYLALVIVLISTLSFGLGRLTGGGEKEGVRIDYDPEISSSQFPISNSNRATVINAVSNIGNSLETENSKIENSTQVVGSKNSTKYHYPHCSGAKLIKEANKVTFASPTAAEAAGYTLAGNCTPK